jgi:hypothetical protein
VSAAARAQGHLTIFCCLRNMLRRLTEIDSGATANAFGSPAQENYPPKIRGGWRPGARPDVRYWRQGIAGTRGRTQARRGNVCWGNFRGSPLRLRAALRRQPRNRIANDLIEPIQETSRPTTGSAF